MVHIYVHIYIYTHICIYVRIYIYELAGGHVSVCWMTHALSCLCAGCHTRSRAAMCLQFLAVLFSVMRGGTVLGGGRGYFSVCSAYMRLHFLESVSTFLHVLTLSRKCNVQRKWGSTILYEKCYNLNFSASKLTAQHDLC